MELAFMFFALSKTLKTPPAIEICAPKFILSLMSLPQELHEKLHKNKRK